MKFYKTILLLLGLSLLSQNLFANENWKIVISNKLKSDEAIKVALEDLKKISSNYEIEFIFKDESSPIENNTILIGNDSRNKITKKLKAKNLLQLKNLTEKQGFQIITTKINSNTVMVVSGGSVIGEVYGIFWIIDRIMVNQNIPDINVIRIPELKIRTTITSITKENLHRALRAEINWVAGGRLNDLVAWGVQPEDSINQKNREEFKELIKYAHSLHLKLLIYTDEFTYHPNILKEFNAKLSPEDDNFWNAVQAKFRRILTDLPGLDGLMFRTGEFTLAGQSSYKAYDVMHGEDDDSHWSLVKRYQKFLKKVHEVVVGEFDKIYFHRTWITNSFEQHSQEQVYSEIFTNEIPTKNLYLSPYINAHDRWFFTNFNPTFNKTPHNMIALLARMDYHSNSNVKVFPTFSGEYFQSALKTFLHPENNNVKGVQFGLPSGGSLSTFAIMQYTSNRLAWNHKEDLRDIVLDFTSIHFGKNIASEMTDIYFLSAPAYKYGIYIEPATYSVFNTLPHLRLTTFLVLGLPAIDNGKEHIEFLYGLYLKCKPWKEETILYLDHGLKLANEMLTKFEKIKTDFDDDVKKSEVENSLLLTRNLIKTNNLYVKSFIAYFDYLNNSSKKNKTYLTENINSLENAIQEFKNTPGFVYNLFGINQLVTSARQTLSDLEKAKSILDKSPSPSEIRITLAKQQKIYRKVLNDPINKKIKILHWEGHVDGRDIINVKLDQLKIKHLRWDDIQHQKYEFVNQLPPKEVTVIPDDLYSRPIHPFVLEQPNKENDFTAKIYLFDAPGGGDWVKFDLYYIDKKPEQLGLQIPWGK